MKQSESILKRKENTIGTLKGKTENNKKFIENNQNHK